ncbi:MAG: hypothetical protein J6B45_03465 [Clostridia bacterium]|nr:hypothetical protein [Clostridia bacterium]
MKEKYNLTGEEVNQILANSPYALSDSPYQKGMGAAQIKKYFYDFITVMAEKFNIHLSDIEADMDTAIQSLEGDILTGREELTAKFTSLIESRLLAQINEHSENSQAHTDIRDLIYQMSSDLRDAAIRAANASETAENAYSLASGKSKVHVALDFRDVLSTLMYAEVNVGDFMIATDKNCPDFIVGDGSYKALAVSVTIDDVASGNLPIAEVGGIYYCEGIDKALIAIESGIDASVFVEREELDAVASGLASLINNKQDKLTFDTKPTPDSENPITSGGVRAEFAAFSEVYDDIIDNSKNEAIQEAQSYTDKKVQKVYEEIATLTLDEDSSVVEFLNLNLSEFYITSEKAGFVDGSKSTLYVYVTVNGDGTSILSNATVGLTATAERGFMCQMSREPDGFISTWCNTSSSGGAWNSQVGVSREVRIPPTADVAEYPITGIKLCTLLPEDGARKWVAGSKFTLWGIEADE